MPRPQLPAQFAPETKHFLVRMSRSGTSRDPTVSFYAKLAAIPNGNRISSPLAKETFRFARSCNGICIFMPYLGRVDARRVFLCTSNMALHLVHLVVETSPNPSTPKMSPK